jgi:tRNA threonylcarbamoyladenosine biosynthesis protein TsaB
MLAVESATAAASVAILRGGAVVAERSGASGQHHSETLLPMVDAVLADAGCRLEEVGAYAISIGPGAFTSLRIGLATIKGLAFGSPAPVAAVSTLEGLSEVARDRDELKIGPGSVIVPLLDARRGEAYAAIHRVPDAGTGALETLLGDCVLTPVEIAARIPPDAVLVGEGAALLADAIRDAAPPAHRIEPAPPSTPHARAVGRVAQRLLSAGAGEPAERLVPRYVRRAQAEVTRTNRRFESP